MSDVRDLAALSSNQQELVRQSVSVRENAYCPYSHFKVGAALVCDDGTTFTGVNVENSSFGATICAERSALVAAVTAGHRKFKRICISAEATGPGFISPCGICRQFMSEFGDFDVLLVRPSDKRVLFTSVHRLLPINLDPLQEFLTTGS
ncbi:probable cytidine deaminase [Neocloeon triangulifer]|uniref:probable cytidine deaminase n=1 Tax=Neocloeon triangulifer TaxID=2078957 RepID=UPI00286F11C6|nr:probable cytidine deaminase [Neocloeon triangulifer]